MQSVTLTSEELRKLLSCGCPDAAVLYLYRKSGKPLETALDALHFTVDRMTAATQCLNQLGLWETTERPFPQPEHPVYTDADLREAMHGSKKSFSMLVGEAQRRLGRTLSTEELKTLLSFTDYLRLPTEVIGLLLSFCIDRNRHRNSRMPSMRAIEKEAYRWADEGIDNLEAASYYIHTQTRLQTQIQEVRRLLQIDNRRLTPSEEKYLTDWVKMGFGKEAISLAYERTCLGTGGLKWAYMNSILLNWHENNLHTVAQIKSGDIAPAQNAHRKNDAVQHHGDKMTPLAKKAIQAALAEGQEDS